MTDSDNFRTIFVLDTVDKSRRITYRYTYSLQSVCDTIEVLLKKRICRKNIREYFDKILDRSRSDTL